MLLNCLQNISFHTTVTIPSILVFHSYLSNPSFVLFNQIYACRKKMNEMKNENVSKDGSDRIHRSWRLVVGATRSIIRSLNCPVPLNRSKSLFFSVFGCTPKCRATSLHLIPASIIPKPRSLLHVSFAIFVIKVANGGINSFVLCNLKSRTQLYIMSRYSVL